MSDVTDSRAGDVLHHLENSPMDKYELADALECGPSTVRDYIQQCRNDGYEIKWDNSESKYYLGDVLHRPAEDISLSKVADALNDPKTLDALASKFTTTAGVIVDLLDELESQGYNVETKDTDKGEVYYFPTEIDKRFSIDDGEGYYRFALISDTHLGSEAEHLQELHEFYDRCVDRGVSRVFHSGDISDGWKVHTGHLNEIKDEAAGWGNLRDYVTTNYPERTGITTHFIEGNHDNKFYNRNNIRFGRLIGMEREDLHYCGNSQATFILDEQHGIDLELIHPSGGKPYTTGYRLQTLYRERNLTERPSIASVGHLHGSMYAETEGVKGLYAGAWKGTTTYGKRKGHQAKIGGWIIDMEVRDGEIRQFTPNWHGFAERESANRYDVKEL
jgi:biotin operon repressor